MREASPLIRAGRSFVLSIATFLAPWVASAAMLASSTDLISDSVPSGTSTNHTITFRSTSGIPAGGSITYRFEGSPLGTFTLPLGMDVSDIDLLIGTTTSTLADRLLAASVGPAADGVSVIGGAGGSVTVDLSPTLPAVPPGHFVRIRVGDHAVVGAVGSRYVESPPLVGSYRVRISTRDVGNTEIDYGSAVVALVSPVTLGPVDNTDLIPPIRSNGLPSGLLPGSTSNVLVSLSTDKVSTCKYDTVPGTDYWSMASSTIMSSANLGTLHYFVLPVTEGSSWEFYVRCANNTGIPNSDDYPILFQIGVVPLPDQPTGPSGSGGGGGKFLFGGDVTLSGLGFPLASLTILRDGQVVAEETSSIVGSFEKRFSQLDRGTYTWSIYGKDAFGHRTATYNSTIFLIAQTNNLIAPIHLSPTLSVASTTIEVGGSLEVRGMAIPVRPVTVFLVKQGEAMTGTITTASTTALGTGSWSLVVPTVGLTKGTYEVRAQSLVGNDATLLSPVTYVGVGEEPAPDFGNRSDLNKDGRVNLVDFSILLFHWRTSDATADINQDGAVNITDFSIMLANWTG